MVKAEVDYKYKAGQQTKENEVRWLYIFKRCKSRD